MLSGLVDGPFTNLTSYTEVIQDGMLDLIKAGKLRARPLAFLVYRSRYGTILKGFGNNPAAVQRSGWSPVKAIAVGYGLASIFVIIGDGDHGGAEPGPRISTPPSHIRS